MKKVGKKVRIRVIQIFWLKVGHNSLRQLCSFAVITNKPLQQVLNYNFLALLELLHQNAVQNLDIKVKFVDQFWPKGLINVEICFCFQR